jgi:hypothetical protein
MFFLLFMCAQHTRVAVDPLDVGEWQSSAKGDHTPTLYLMVKFDYMTYRLIMVWLY